MEVTDLDPGKVAALVGGPRSVADLADELARPLDGTARTRSRRSRSAS